MLEVTIDTNVFQEYEKKQDKWEVAGKVFALAEQGKIDMTLTTRVRADMPDGPLREALESRLAKSWFTLSPAAIQYDSDSGEETDYASDFMIDDFMAALEKRDRKRGRRKKIPSQIDRDHVQGYHLSRRDVFLTWDKEVLRWAADLKRRFGILVMTPEAFLEQFSEEGEGMLRGIRELQIEGKVLNDCQIIVAGRELGFEEMEITLSHTLRMFTSLLPKADQETIEEVLENLADKGILKRREGVEPTYVLAWSNEEWAKKWVAGSVAVDEKWRMLCLIRDMSTNPEVMEMAIKVRERTRETLEAKWAREERE
ncbi:MAG: hypothetical protein OXC18_04965 [Desulfurellaceae bacterium]|nr:hypothetical protein [Desulfurellaceae bacterium]